MGQPRAFLITGDGAEQIANDVCDFRYRARRRQIPAGHAEQASVNIAAETQILLTAGRLEIMVGGFATNIGPGAFARIPAGVHFAWRNAGPEPVELLVHTTTPGHVCKTLRLDTAVPLSRPDAPA